MTLYFSSTRQSGIFVLMVYRWDGIVVIAAAILCSQEKPAAKKSGQKAKKDPDAPKRPSSAYFIWMNEQRQSIKAANPEFSVTDISKKAGEMWSTLTDKSVRHRLLPTPCHALNYTGKCCSYPY